MNGKISLFSLVLLIVAAIDSIRTLPTTALFGSSLLFFGLEPPPDAEVGSHLEYASMVACGFFLLIAPVALLWKRRAICKTSLG